MYKADDVPPEALYRVNHGEKVFRELTGLPFTIRSPAYWDSAFQSASFSDIYLEEHSNASQLPYALNSVDEFGGWGKLMGTLWGTFILALGSGKMRECFAKIGEAKGALLRDKVANMYLGYILCIGRMSLISRIEELKK